jgi:hypothetical protein
MSTISIYQSSAPVLAKMLNTLSHLLDAAEAHAAQKKIDFDVLLNARLAPDMLPLSGQLALSTAFAKNAAARLAGDTPPDFPDSDKTLADFRARIARALDIVQSYNEAAMVGSAERDITFGMGPEIKVTLKGADYLTDFVLPNFFFHMSMAYAILRHNGVALGKKDFLRDLMGVHIK